MTDKNKQRIDVLTYKMRGMSPHEIAHKMSISHAEVMKHDREIKKMMAKGDAEEMSRMSPDELQFAQKAVSSLLPFMEKSLSTINKEVKTLHTLHTTALEVAEKALNLISTKLDDPNISLNDLDRLTDIFTRTYNSLYNKNGVQVINLLADSVRDPERDRLDAHKAMMKESLDSMKVIPAVIDAELEE